MSLSEFDTLAHEAALLRRVTQGTCPNEWLFDDNSSDQPICVNSIPIGCSVLAAIKLYDIWGPSIIADILKDPQVSSETKARICGYMGNIGEPISSVLGE